MVTIGQITKGEMPIAGDRIMTTHVGSLLRPPDLIAFLRKIEAGEPYDKAAYEACLKTSRDHVVREAGVAIVSDGEFSQGRNWACRDLTAPR